MNRVRLATSLLVLLGTFLFVGTSNLNLAFAAGPQCNCMKGDRYGASSGGPLWECQVTNCWIFIT